METARFRIEVVLFSDNDRSIPNSARSITIEASGSPEVHDQAHAIIRNLIPFKEKFAYALAYLYNSYPSAMWRWRIDRSGTIVDDANLMLWQP